MKNNSQSLPGSDDILRKTLPNQITVLVRENPQSQTIVIKGALLTCGSFFDPVDKDGLAQFMTSCLMYGTETHSSDEIASMIDFNGASLSFGASANAINFSARSLVEDLPMLLSLIRETLEQPAFPLDKIELIRRQFLTAIDIRRYDTDETANDTFDHTLFGDHPYGRQNKGTKESILSITADDVHAFHHHHVSPQGLILSIVGGISAGKAADMVQSVFSDWQSTLPIVVPDIYFPRLDPSKAAVRIHMEIPEKSEMTLVTGGFGPSRSDPGFYPAALGNCILGEFGMMGRIGKVVRDDNGLAYYAGSSLDSSLHGGTWLVSAGTNPDNLEKALNLIHQELHRFLEEPVTAEELSDVKSFYTGSLPLSLESNSGVAGAILTGQIYGLGINYLRELPQRVNAVTAESILEAANRFIDPDHAITVTAGTKGITQ